MAEIHETVARLALDRYTKNTPSFARSVSVKKGDLVFEPMMTAMCYRQHDQHYPKAIGYLLDEIKPTGMVEVDCPVRLQTLSGEIIDWTNCIFIRIDDDIAKRLDRV